MSGRPTIRNLQTRIIDLEQQVNELTTHNQNLEAQITEMIFTADRADQADQELERFHLNWSPEALAVISNRATVNADQIKNQHRYQSVSHIPLYKNCFKIIKFKNHNTIYNIIIQSVT